MSLNDISTWGLSDEDKAEVETMKRELTADGLSEEEIVGIIGSFISDCLQASAERRGE